MKVIDPRQIRDGLDVFEPNDITLCTPHLQAYLEHYRLIELMPLCDYSIGRECVDGLDLVVQQYRPKEAVRGTTVLLHGYTDHAGLYRHLIDFLLQRGWNVLIYDLPGHGLSGGAALGIDHFSTYARQLSVLLERHQGSLPGPWVLMGQSTGAAILMEQQRGGDPIAERVAGRVYLAPLIRPVMMDVIARKYRWFGRFLKQVKRNYSENSGDASFVRFVRLYDPLQHSRVAVSWVRAMLEWVKLIEASAPLGGTPLLLQGQKDGTVDWRHNMAVLQRLYPSLQPVLIPGARHHLVNETPPLRRELFGHIGNYLDAIDRAAGVERGM
uniref:alpha/beta hydrolase n=1 Tax=Marinobacterium profundum TaxID=1714300 RepID=UPI0008368E80|nr:alpha/beta hydrolase [Marinobacterium profundum]